MNLPANLSNTENSNSTFSRESDGSARKRVKLESYSDRKWKIQESETEVLAEIGLGVLEDNLNDSSQSDSNSRCKQQVITNYFPSQNSKRKNRGSSPTQKPFGLIENSASPADKENDHDYLNCTNPLMVVSSNFNLNEDMHTNRTKYQSSLEKVRRSTVSKCSKKNNKINNPKSNENINMQKSASGVERSPLSNLYNNRLSQTREIQNVQDFYIYRKRNNSPQIFDMINRLSDEMVLSIFKWLPKQTLSQCSLVCKRWHRISQDESLWLRIDLGGKILPNKCIERILSRGAMILRMAQAEIGKSLFCGPNVTVGADFQSKLQYLDLSMAVISIDSLNQLLARCKILKKLSLEHVRVDDETCRNISENHNLDALNLCMSAGITLQGVKYLMDGCKQLQALNISWTCMSYEAIQYLCDHLHQNLTKLNIAGNRKTLTDKMVETLVRNCSYLIDLDLSDCTMLTEATVHTLGELMTLEHLSLSRCYNIKPTAYIIIHKYTSLMYLDIFGLMSEQAITKLSTQLPHIGINKFLHSAIARPTVGTRRTSIWGLRTRD